MQVSSDPVCDVTPLTKFCDRAHTSPASASVDSCRQTSLLREALGQPRTRPRPIGKTKGDSRRFHVVCARLGPLRRSLLRRIVIGTRHQRRPEHETVIGRKSTRALRGNGGALRGDDGSRDRPSGVRPGPRTVGCEHRRHRRSGSGHIVRLWAHAFAASRTPRSEAATDWNRPIPANGRDRERETGCRRRGSRWRHATSDGRRIPVRGSRGELLRPASCLAGWRTRQPSRLRSRALRQRWCYW